MRHTLILLALSFLTFSCSKETEAPSTKSIMEQGKWRVALFTDNGVNETNTYTGYAFTFKNNGTVAAVNGTSTINGTWTTGGDESLNRFKLDFGATVLSELNEDWSFTDKSYSVVRMEHLTTGSTDTEVLVLEKF